jgi:hypothetical protein
VRTEADQDVQHQAGVELRICRFAVLTPVVRGAWCRNRLPRRLGTLRRGHFALSCSLYLRSHTAAAVFARLGRDQPAGVGMDAAVRGRPSCIGVACCPAARALTLGRGATRRHAVGHCAARSHTHRSPGTQGRALQRTRLVLAEAPRNEHRLHEGRDSNAGTASTCVGGRRHRCTDLVRSTVRLTAAVRTSVDATATAFVAIRSQWAGMLIGFMGRWYASPCTMAIRRGRAGKPVATGTPETRE